MIKLYSSLLLSIILLLGAAQTAQAQQSKQDIKNHFQNGYAPGAAHFGYLIEACYNYSVGEGLIYDTANNLLKAEVPLSILEQNLRDTAQILRSQRDAKLKELSQQLINTQNNSSGAVSDLEHRLNNQIVDTASSIRQKINLLSGQVNQLDADKTYQLADTAQNIRLKMHALNSQNQTRLNNEVILLNDKISGTQSALQDTTQQLRLDFQIKLNQLEEALQDTAQVIRTSLNAFYNALNQKIELEDSNLSDLISQTQISLINKIDSLAEVHNIDRVIQENRMTQIETDHSVLRDTVVKMKIKLDTLHFTEENFTQTLRLKLDNIEDGATRADNNFTDALKTKLDGIENNANNYQLPLGTHNKLGGIQLSQDFVLYNGKAYNALDASKIDREYAKDTITKNWTSEMKTDDEWTRIRYKMENGSVDGDGNKLYDYGEWNQAYKFIYDDLETSFYEFNATDSLNVILGIHEKDKFFTGKNNTIIGHNAGYTLYKGGERNVVIGKNAGRGSENVSDNVFVGNQAGESIGDPSQSASVSGDFSSERNVALGTKAMQGRNASGKSVAIGFSAMELGEQNSSVAIGYSAASNNSGTNNIAIGYEAGLSVSGSNNTSTITIGCRAGYKNTYAKHNIFIGDSSALINESGEKNIFIGHGTGKSNTGNGNLLIGNNINLAGNDQLAIGNKGNILISGDFTTNTVSIDKLSTGTLTVANTNSNNYSIANKEVINNSSQFVGEGGVNTSAQIKSTYANAKGNTNTAISAPNGTVSAKYISGSDAILIGNTDVINTTGTFVGLGGVNTNGDIISNGAVSGNTLHVKSIKGSEALEIAGLSIVKLSGGIPVERYALKSHNHNPEEINTNSANRFVSDADKGNWNNKVSQAAGKGLSSNDYTSVEKAKLNGIAEGANKYIHPTSHSANIITQDANNRFVSDAEKTSWSNKADKADLSSNDFSDAEKSKLAGIMDGANKYTHPDTHSADMIVPTTNKQFVSQTEKDNWSAGKIPIGGIIMWNGTNIPAGWVLCNGQLINGTQTPDLRGRFIVGSYPGKSGFDSGNSGGIVTNAGQTSTSGIHTHTGNTGGYKLTSNDLPSHSHGMTHTHKIPAKKGVKYSATADDSNPGGSGSGSRRTMDAARDYNFSTEASSKSRTDNEGKSNWEINAHQHTISSDGSHVHTVPYYVLAFIMRVE